MPTRFRLALDAQFKDTISGQTAAVRSKRQSNEWVPYAAFVENLGKEMATPGEEAHHHTTGMAGEAGELLDITKKTWIYGKPLDIEHIIEEMGDLRWYYQSMLNMLGLTDEDIQAANTIKLMKRYPNGVYSNADAIARADKAGEQEEARHAPAPRKFMGMPPKEPPTRHPSTYVSSSESKPLPDDAVYDDHCMTPARQNELAARIKEHMSARDVRQEHTAVMRELGQHESDGQEHSDIMREITGS